MNSFDKEMSNFFGRRGPRPIAKRRAKLRAFWAGQWGGTQLVCIKEGFINLMTIKTILSAALITAASATLASAATIDLGDVTTGASTTGEIVGTKNGDFYTFSLNAASGFGVTMLDIDTAGSDFGTDIALYDSNDMLVAENNNGPNTSPASRILLDSGVIANGDYTLVVGAWNVNFATNLADISFNGFPSGDYNVNIQTTVSAVPLPAGGLLLLSGLAGIATVRRRKARD